MSSTCWVDFKAVKHAVSMEMALAYYGVMLRRIHGPCLRGRCPLPSHASRGQCSESDCRYREECMGLSLGFLRRVTRWAHRRQCARFRGCHGALLGP